MKIPFQQPASITVRAVRIKGLRALHPAVFTGRHAGVTARANWVRNHHCELSQTTPPVINIPMTCQKRLLILVFLSWIIAVPVAAIAGPHKGVVGPMEPATPVIVSGKLLTYEGQPAASQRIHFENAVSGDLFLAKTGPDGSFAFALPPGGYELRVEQGPIVVDFIDAQGEAVYAGHGVRTPKDPILAASRGTGGRPDSESGSDYLQRTGQQSILSDRPDTT